MAYLKIILISLFLIGCSNESAKNEIRYIETQLNCESIGKELKSKHKIHMEDEDSVGCIITKKDDIYYFNEKELKIIKRFLRIKTK